MVGNPLPGGPHPRNARRVSGMDSSINAAARALATGDPLGALNHVALRDDATALALRGTAMAQLGEFERARKLLRVAERRFGPGHATAQARCVVALAEIDLALRELKPRSAKLDTAIEHLAKAGEGPNLALAHLIRARQFLLLGHVEQAEQQRARVSLTNAPHKIVALAELVRADIETRKVHAADAVAALTRAQRAARQAGVPALRSEIDKARGRLDRPAARIVREGVDSLATLAEVERLLASDALVVNACQRQVNAPEGTVDLARRPVLFAIAQTLGEPWPAGTSRSALIQRVFEAVDFNDSHRVRLRVEIGRLRKLLAGIASIEAVDDGYVLQTDAPGGILVLLPPWDGGGAALLALLADGAAWSTSALSLAVGVSSRSVQRALAGLHEEGRVLPVGRGRTQRWVLPPASTYATTLLLPTHELVG